MKIHIKLQNVFDIEHVLRVKFKKMLEYVEFRSLSFIPLLSYK